MTEEMRVILFKEEGMWVAQGLERDICAVAESLDDLYGRFEVTVRIESCREGGIERIDPAPKHFFDLWDRQAGGYQPRTATNEGLRFAMAA